MKKQRAVLRRQFVSFICAQGRSGFLVGATTGCAVGLTVTATWLQMPLLGHSGSSGVQEQRCALRSQVPLFMSIHGRGSLAGFGEGTTVGPERGPLSEHLPTLGFRVESGVQAQRSRFLLHLLDGIGAHGGRTWIVGNSVGEPCTTQIPLLGALGSMGLQTQRGLLRSQVLMFISIQGRVLLNWSLVGWNVGPPGTLRQLPSSGVAPVCTHSHWA